jgi:purine nucleosidase
MLQPEIAKKLTLVWIGGGSTSEYNLLSDPLAARYIFNETEASIWQVSEGVYATYQVSMTELQAFVAPYGATGAWRCKQALRGLDELGNRFPINTGEIWSMGDSPLVLLTALSDFANRRGANIYHLVFTPYLNERGVAQPRFAGRRL